MGTNGTFHSIHFLALPTLEPPPLPCLHERTRAFLCPNREDHARNTSRLGKNLLFCTTSKKRTDSNRDVRLGSEEQDPPETRRIAATPAEATANPHPAIRKNGSTGHRKPDIPCQASTQTPRNPRPTNRSVFPARKQLSRIHQPARHGTAGIGRSTRARCTKRATPESSIEVRTGSAPQP